MHLTLHLTTACNMRCSYCYSPPRAGEPMSERTGRQALELGARLTQGVSCGIVFFGGEPLLHKDLIRSLVEYARHLEQKGAGRFHFKATTNGVLLDSELLYFAVQNDILVAMSFDGIRAAHDRHRRFPDGGGTFDLLLPRLEALLAVRPYASVLMVVNPDTAEHLCDSVAFLIEKSCRYLIVSLNYAAPWDERSLLILKRQLGKLAKAYIRWTRQGKKFYLSPFEVKLSSHINRHCHLKERCELARRQISVDPRGYLFPCVQFVRADSDSPWCIGRVDRGIDEKRRSAIHAASQSQKAECLPCAIRDRCNNSCGCLNWQTMGTVNRVSPVLCRYEQMLVPLADRIGRVLYGKRDPTFLHKHYNAAYPVLSLLEDALARKT